MFSLYAYRIYETGREFNLDLMEKQFPDEHAPTRVFFFPGSPQVHTDGSVPFISEVGDDKSRR